MGGKAVRNEPGSMTLLELYPEAYQIFLQAGWVDYFRRLQEFDSQQVLEFARNLKEGYATIQGVRIPVTEEDIAQVSGLPANGIRWFSHKHIILNAQQDFLLPGERVEPKGRGVALHSLPPTWPKVAEFVKHYLTREGRYQVVYQHDFVLLNHLRHGRLLNMPYYLLRCLKNMSHYSKDAKYPFLSLTHHRLVQLLILRGFALQNPPPLNNPPQEAAEIPQLAAENPQEAAEVTQPAAENPQETAEISQVAAETPQMNAENPQPSVTASPIDPAIASTLSHNLPESSIPTVHIPSGDSDDEIPMARLRRKRKRQETVVPSSKR